MNKVKYPRTPHLPWSPGSSSDDIVLGGADKFLGKDVVVTEKMDGENTTLYAEGMHARSLDSQYHPSRDWLKQYHATFAHEIPENWRICGENLYAQHSVPYEELPSYFLAFSIWDDRNRCLSWQDSLEWFEAIGLAHPKILYSGPWDEALIQGLQIDPTSQEGYVVRLAGEFAYEDFSGAVAKWVRPSHVTSDKHWSLQELVPNRLAGPD